MFSKIIIRPNEAFKNATNAKMTSYPLACLFINQDLLCKYNLFKNKFIYKNIKLYIFNDDFDQKWCKKLNVTMLHNNGLDN